MLVLAAFLWHALSFRSFALCKMPGLTFGSWHQLLLWGGCSSHVPSGSVGNRSNSQSAQVCIGHTLCLGMN